MTDIPKIKLNDGNKIPQLGFGDSKFLTMMKQ